MDVYNENNLPRARTLRIPRTSNFMKGASLDVHELAIHHKNVAVSGDYYEYSQGSNTGGKKESTFIDLFTLADPDSTSPSMIQCYSKEFVKTKRLHRYVSFLDNSHIVTVYDSLLEVYNINSKDKAVKQTEIEGKEAYCMTVSERFIYVCLKKSNKVTVFDEELSVIKSITLNKMRRCWPGDIAVYEDNLYITTGLNRRAMKYNMEGRHMYQYAAPDQISYANSITASGLICILWGTHHVMIYSLYDSLLIACDINCLRIRIVNVSSLFALNRHYRVNEFNLKTPLASYLTYGKLKENLVEKLPKSACQQLASHFRLSTDQVNVIISSDSPSKDLIAALEERGIMHAVDVTRLLEALTSLRINEDVFHIMHLYEELTDEESSYERFLAGLSSHLTLSLLDKFFEYFHFVSEKKDQVISSENPGLSFLLALEEKGIINRFDVRKLEVPLERHQQVQAVARVQEYQSLVEDKTDEKPLNTLEEKKRIFTECLRKKIKSWYATMTPIPWKKSCKWTTSELFITCGLILTRSKSKLKNPDVDSDCKLQYKDIFTHDRLKGETRIIIEGDPGSGKTMLSSQLVYDWSMGKISDADMVILLPLKFVEDMTIIEAIEKFYIPEGQLLDSGDIKSILSQASEESKAFIVLDGLEEYNGGPEDGEPSEIMRVMRREKLANCTVVLTSRSDFVQNLPECPMLKLGQFGEDERGLYIAKILPDNKEMQQKVTSTINSSSFLLDLCSTPLMFVLIVHNVDILLQFEVKGELGRVGSFMQAMVDRLLSQSNHDGQGTVQVARLAEIAFNGLCRGHQQLTWQKHFLDTNVSEMKKFVESGILVVEEDPMMGTRYKQRYQSKEEGQNVEQVSLYQEKAEETMQFGESSDGVLDEKLRQHDAAAVEVQNDENVGIQKSRPQTKSRAMNPQRVPLEVKFLHKIIQEWFAAIHFSSLLEEALEDHRQGILDKHLPLIKPTDLHYLLRFTSYLCPESCHLIMESLYSGYQIDGTVPEYILNCIFLCFAEFDSSTATISMDKETIPMDSVVTQMCKNTVIIRGEDSLLLQQSKVSMLTYASHSKIEINRLNLVNLVVKVVKSTVTFNSSLTLQNLLQLQTINVSRWDHKLEVEDYENLMSFIDECKSLKRAIFNFPSPPPKITDNQLLSFMKKELTVEWSIGERVKHTLNKKTGEWAFEFKRPASGNDETSDACLDSSLPGTSTRVSESEVEMIQSDTDEESDEEKGFEAMTQEVTPYKVSCASLETQFMANMNGGMFSIPDTGVELEIPPGTLEVETLIQMRIIPHHFQDEQSLSFESNSSVVVELLPSKLELRKPAKLTLPHCLVLKKGERWTAKVYSSHHEEGQPPQWKEEKTACSELHDKTCMVWLHNFSWKKFEVGDGEIVEAKEILLFAARRLPSTNTTVYLDTGCCLNLPRALEAALSPPPMVLLHSQKISFYKDGALALKFFFEKTKPQIWMCDKDETRQEIKFKRVVSSESCSCTFVLKKRNTKTDKNCTCYFKVGQKEDLVNLVFPLQKGDTVSTLHLPAESAKREETKEKTRKRKADQSPPSSVLVYSSIAGSSTESLSTDISQLKKADETPSSSKVPKLNTVNDDILRDLSAKIPNEWRDVGRNLGLEDDTIDQIDRNKPEIKEKIYKMLKTWKQQNGKAATKSKLGDALKKAGRTDLQEKFFI